MSVRIDYDRNRRQKYQQMDKIRVQHVARMLVREQISAPLHQSLRLVEDDHDGQYSVYVSGPSGNTVLYSWSMWHACLRT